MLVELSLGWEFEMTEIAFPGRTIPCSISRGIRRWRSVLASCAIGDHTLRIGDNVVRIMLQNVGVYHMPSNPTIASTGLKVEDDI